MDSLTGLLTRKEFQVEASNIILSGEKNFYPAIIWFNLDNFKMFNSRFGFDTGDEVLKQISDVLRKIFSNRTNLIARFSDDNFVILADWSDAEFKIDDIQEFLGTLLENAVLRLRAGVYFPSDYEDIQASCDKAKIACDSIRKNHSVNSCMFHDGMKKDLALQQYILDNLDSAISNRYIKILYQPIINLQNMKICETEALARWNDPELGFISPSEFVPTLEKYREIHKLDIYAMKYVCRDLRRRIDNNIPVLPVSINLSRLDFELCDIIREIELEIEANDLSREMLRIEITETINEGYTTGLNLGIEKLRAFGYEIWMDDFGSGYSSLNVLKDYNFDTIKFDMKFLHDFDINKSEKAKYIISANLSMARLMGMKALAEGVETPEQFEYLRSIGFDKAQGYYFGKPTEIEKISNLVGLPGLEPGTFRL